MKKSDILDLTLRIVVGGIFAVSGYLKLLESPANFIGAILSYKIIDPSLASLAANTLPWAELILGVFLILGFWRALSFYALSAMNMIFVVAISSALLRKIPIKDCGCFGEGMHAWPIQWTLAMDIAIFVALLYLRPKPKKA